MRVRDVRRRLGCLVALTVMVAGARSGRSVLDRDGGARWCSPAASARVRSPTPGDALALGGCPRGLVSSRERLRPRRWPPYSMRWAVVSGLGPGAWGESRGAIQ